LKPGSKQDNFLLEMELAVGHSRANRMGIYPLLVGSVQPDGIYRTFDSKIFRLEGIPEVPSPTSKYSPKTTLSQLFKYQVSLSIWRMPMSESAI
jgi:hypothetical protein